MSSTGSSSHRGSIFWPLLLIAIGVLFLLRHEIPGFDLWAWAARFWPVLLILWGALRLLEHFTDPGQGGLGGGEIVLLILIVLGGLALTASEHWRENWNEGWPSHHWVLFGGWDPWANEYSFAAQSRLSLQPGDTVAVRSARGDVELVPAPAGAGANQAQAQVAASVSYEVVADSAAAAQRKFAASALRFERQGSVLVVLPAGGDPPEGVRANLRLQLPPSAPARITAADGEVRVSGWRAPLEASLRGGDLDVEDAALPAGGALRLRAAGGNIHVAGARAAVIITGQGGDLTLRDVSGPVTVSGRFGGELTFAHLASGLQFTSNRTQITLASLPGDLEGDGATWTGEGTRDLRLETYGRDVEIRQFLGALAITDRHGLIFAAAAPLPPGGALAPISLRDDGGDIQLALPAVAAFDLRAQTGRGSIGGDWLLAARAAPVLEVETRPGHRGDDAGDSGATLNQVFGRGGPLVSLVTTRGDIRLTQAPAR